MTSDNKRIYLPRTILGAMRVAVFVMALVMASIAYRISDYALLPGPWHRVPFIMATGLATTWGFGICHFRIVLWCSALLVALFVLRGVELALWAPSSFGFVASVTWTLVGVWCFALGVINRVVISQMKAGEIWDTCSPK